MGTATDLGLALDRVAFAEATGITPDAWQRGVLRSEAPQSLWLCARQTGKSLAAALLGLHVALYEAGALVLVISPSLRQSQELFRRMRVALAALGPDVPQPVAETAQRLEFPGGARVVCLPGDAGTIRGYSQVRLLVVDEGAWLPDPVYYSIRPMLATSPGGQLVCLSTPHGRRGWLWREWSEGEGWERTTITAADCARISPDWLERERLALGPFWAPQELDCVFVDAEDSVFRSEDVAAALDPAVEPLWPEHTGQAGALLIPTFTEEHRNGAHLH